MKRLLKTLLLLGILVPYQASAAFAGGGGLMGGATELTQIANNAELGGIYGQTAQSVYNEIEQINNQIKMITNQIQQYAELVKSTMTMPLGAFNDVLGQIQNLYGSVSASEGIFSAFGNTESWLNYAKSRRGVLTASQQAQQAVKESDASNQVLAKTASKTHNDSQTTAGKLTDLSSRNRAVSGQTQALQVGNDINALTAAEVTKLRNDFATYLEYVAEKDNQRQEVKEMQIKRVQDEIAEGKKYIGNW